MFMERIDVNILHADPQSMIAVLAAASGRGAQVDPVGGPVTGSPKTRALHEGLDQLEAITVLSRPIRAQPAQNMDDLMPFLAAGLGIALLLFPFDG